MADALPSDGHEHPDDTLVVLRDVVKAYRRGTERVNLRAATPWLSPRRGRDGHLALDGISLRVDAGETLGVIGPNGSGKSTLLKLVAGVTLPTEGEVCTRGRIASLIELGVGFHPDLTGEENIWYTAAVLGMDRDEVRGRRDEIVAFAGIDDAIATPVKRYSSGMLARLGFAVATHVDADLLIVDEVLSVGDADFQRRSYERMRELKAGGTAIAFVSHDLWIVGQICDRVVALEEGRVVDEGPPIDVVDRYAGLGVAEGGVWGRAPVQLEEVHVDPPTIGTGGGFDVHATLSVHEPTPAARLYLRVHGDDGTVVADTPIGEAAIATAEPGRWQVRGEIFTFPFSSGIYRVELTVLDGGEATAVLSRATGSVEVAGPLSRRPSVRLHDQWTVVRADDPSAARPASDTTTRPRDRRRSV